MRYILIIRNVGARTREQNGHRGCISCLISKVKVSVALAFLLNMAECTFLLYNCFLFSWMRTSFQKEKKITEVPNCVLCLNTCTNSYVAFILDTAPRWWLSSFLCCSGFPGCIIREQNNCRCWLFFFNVYFCQKIISLSLKYCYKWYTIFVPSTR